MLPTSQTSNDDLVDGKDALDDLAKLPPTPPAETGTPLYTVNDILLHRIPHPPGAPLVGYPQSTHGISDYKFYTAEDLDRFANGSANIMQDSGLPKVTNLELHARGYLLTTHLVLRSRREPGSSNTWRF